MKKTGTYLWLLILVFGVFSACQDDSTTQFSGITITENMSNDAGTVTKKDQYLYENNQLVSHSTAQSYGQGQSLSQTTSISYSDKQVIITYALGDIATYTLGANGYATQCTYLMGYQIRTYDFAYSDGYLTQVDEQIDGIPGMSNTLIYHNGDLASIRFGESNEVVCSPDNTINAGNLPCTLLANLYPLSLHMDAIYAHILGKSTQHMMGSYEPINNNSESQDSEKTTYKYTTDSQQRTIGVQQKTIYAGLIYDNAGNAHQTESFVTRIFTISYQ